MAGSSQVWVAPLAPHRYRAISFVNQTFPGALGRFGSRARAEQFAASRWLLARLLRERFGILHAPLSKRPGGQPFLRAHPQVGVSVAHTDEHVMVAVNPQGAIGVDLESLGRRVDMHGIAKKMFRENERAFWKRGGHTAEHFFSIWTAKEAWGKAAGHGLAGDGRSVASWSSLRRGLGPYRLVQVGFDTIVCAVVARGPISLVRVA